MVNTFKPEQPLPRTYFHGSKGVRAIEVLRYIKAKNLSHKTSSVAPLSGSRKLNKRTKRKFLQRPFQFVTNSSHKTLSVARSAEIAHRINESSLLYKVPSSMITSSRAALSCEAFWFIL